jgi:DNA-binding NarL/FixJ family response regulator
VAWILNLSNCRPSGCSKPSSRIGEDPARIAQDNEDCERLAAAVESLTERQRRVWEALSKGESLQTIARQFGVTSMTVWNWRQQIIAILREKVRDPRERA